MPLPTNGGSQKTTDQSPSKNGTGGDGTQKILTYADVEGIFEQRCAMCHNADSGLPDWGDPQLSQARAQRIYVRVVEARDMPPGNVTDMTEEERALVGQWVTEGAKLAP